MKLKSFFAESVEAALGQAREELGADAILVNSRKSPPEARHLGEYEVVAAWMPSDAPAPLAAADHARSSSEQRAVPRSPDGDSGGRLCRELAELRRQMDRMRKAVWLTGLNRAAPAGARTGVLSALLEADLDPALAQEIAACVEARMAGDPLLETETKPVVFTEDASHWRAHTTSELERRFSVDASLGRPGGQAKIAALVGPAGAGKTTALAKLAVQSGLARRQPVQLLSLDTYRIASSEPLRTYAGILGIGFQTLATGVALEQALTGQRPQNLVLIDTPGFGPLDMDGAAELADLFSAHPEIEIHLVLPATMKSADLTCAVDRFEVFRPSKLLFTRADETSTFGPVFSEASRTGKPISFLATGQRVPDDLEAATKKRVVELILETRMD